MPGYEARSSILQDLGDMIFKLVSDRATPKQWAEWLRVPLEHAAGTANHDLVDKLLKSGADGNAGWCGCSGRTLLHASAQGGSTHVMSAMIRAGANPDKDIAQANTGHTPLHCAIIGGHRSAAKVLMMAGANVNIVDAKNNSPLHLAIKGGHEGLAENLLLSGADPNMRSSSGACPIHLAAHRGQDEVVHDLMHKGADQNSVNAEGRTPLRIAVYENHVSTVKVLLAGGADANFPCPKHSGALLHVAARYDRTGSIPLLIEAGADIEARCDKGQTPLFVASFFGSRAAMLALLQLGANVDTKTNRGSTPLHGACMQGRVAVADLLLRWEADETAVDNKNKTASARIPDIAQAAEENRPELHRLSKLMAQAPRDKAWRRRGIVVMCHARLGRTRLASDIPESEANGRSSRRARRGRVKMEVVVGGSQGAGHHVGPGPEGVGRAERRTGGSGGPGGGFDGAMAWLMTLAVSKEVVNEHGATHHPHDGIFRKIVGFL